MLIAIFAVKPPSHMRILSANQWIIAMVYYLHLVVYYANVQEIEATRSSRLNCLAANHAANPA